MFVELLPGADVSTEDLHQHAQSSIDERPAWPKLIQVIDTIPLTTVGKIFKPSLRCDTAKQKVTDLVQNEFGLANARVDVVIGGARGMRVTVTLSEGDRSSVAELETALAAFLFEARVHVI